MHRTAHGTVRLIGPFLKRPEHCLSLTLHDCLTADWQLADAACNAVAGHWQQAAAEQGEKNPRPPPAASSG